MNILVSSYKDYSFSMMRYSFDQANDYKYVIYEMKTKTGNGHYQLIAYIDCNAKYFVKLYIDCKNMKAYKDNSQIFLDSVKGITYLNTIIENKK
jgi:hypothetical protein